MSQFPQVVYVRKDGDESNSKSNLKTAIFQSELMRVGKKSKVGAYRLMSVVDIAGKPEPKKSNTADGKKTGKKKEGD